MNGDFPSILWLGLTTLGALAFGGMMAWALARYRAVRDRRPGRPTDGPNVTVDQTGHRAMEAAASAGSHAVATRSRDLRGLALVFCAAMVGAGLVLATMFAVNTEPAKSAAIGERR